VTLLERLARLGDEGGRAVLFTVVEGDGVGAKALVVEGAETLGDGVPAWALEMGTFMPDSTWSLDSDRSTTRTPSSVSMSAVLQFTLYARAATATWTPSATL